MKPLFPVTNCLVRAPLSSGLRRREYATLQSSREHIPPHQIWLTVPEASWLVPNLSFLPPFWCRSPSVPTALLPLRLPLSCRAHCSLVHMLFPSVNRLAVPSPDPIDVPVQVQRLNVQLVQQDFSGLESLRRREEVASALPGGEIDSCWLILSPTISLLRLGFLCSLFGGVTCLSSFVDT
ncbi:hypothetical protein Pdw03_2331 [Penicillium digitatum]|uniref:Uncharacterized protein n=1 Tax=Penicillium digitatum TaxID=36651 RepID=A0A7T6XE65_PENDI|nr:hypothetical protein Pdw03_2331 [Penicillium digitatum]